MSTAEVGLKQAIDRVADTFISEGDYTVGDSLSILAKAMQRLSERSDSDTSAAVAVAGEQIANAIGAGLGDIADAIRNAHFESAALYDVADAIRGGKEGEL